MPRPPGPLTPEGERLYQIAEAIAQLCWVAGMSTDDLQTLGVRETLCQIVRGWCKDRADHKFLLSVVFDDLWDLEHKNAVPAAFRQAFEQDQD